MEWWCRGVNPTRSTPPRNGNEGRTRPEPKSGRSQRAGGARTFPLTLKIIKLKTFKTFKNLIYILFKTTTSQIPPSHILFFPVACGGFLLRVLRNCFKRLHRKTLENKAILCLYTPRRAILIHKRYLDTFYLQGIFIF